MSKHDLAFQGLFFCLLGGLVGLGASMIDLAAWMKVPVAEAAMASAMLHLLGSATWSYGLMRTAESRGHAAAWGFSGLAMMLPFVGFIPYLLLRMRPDRYLEVGDALAIERAGAPLHAVAPARVLSASDLVDRPLSRENEAVPEARPLPNRNGGATYRW